MDERPKKPQRVDLAALGDVGDFMVRSAELPDERQSRLKREEAEADHRLRSQAAEDARRHQLALIVHAFVMAIVTTALAAGIYITIALDSKSGLPDKAITMIAGIAGGLVGYLAGTKTK